MLRRTTFASKCIACTLILAAAPAAFAANKLEGRAVLPAATFAPGPTSARFAGAGPFNGQTVPFKDKQPVQGFSAVLANGDGTFWAMSDNGFGSIENSADYNLRVYMIRPDFKTRGAGSGQIQILNFIELSDPDKKISFTITNHFTASRVLTGADFDIEAMQRAADGTLWFGDEFGPFLLHTDANGRLLEAPIPLPDFDNPGKEIRSPQNPYNEETSALRIMNAVRRHAELRGNTRIPVFSPWDVMLDDNNAATFIDNRATPPADSGLRPASSEIFNVASMKSAGYPVVVWTVNDVPRMLELMKLGVNGIISDRPDLLLEAVRQFDANNDGAPGDWIGADGLIDSTKFDAQGHRGGRNLRPENTLPAMEAALDSLMTTLETDTGITADGVPVLDHDPHVEAAKCRLVSGGSYPAASQVLVKDVTLSQLQSQYICDKIIRDPAAQKNDLSLSPAAVAFAESRGIHPYAMPSLQQLFDFVKYYEQYYRTGAGKTHSEAERRWKNAQRVRFNIETKINPRREFSSFTTGPDPFANSVASVIVANNLATRADIQSFDFRTLLSVHDRYPAIRTVFLFGDFPIFTNRNNPGSDDGTNLQDEQGANTPWLAGLSWPYRATRRDYPFRALRSGGFEGMAMNPGKTKLYPLLEGVLVNGEAGTLLIHEFDIWQRRYTGTRYKYPLNARGTNIGDFILFSDTKGLVIERDNSQGSLTGFKAIYTITLGQPGGAVSKSLTVDLMDIADPNFLSWPGQTGDIGIGRTFAFPFVTIEDVVVFDDRHIGVINDNNFPFSLGRHLGTGQPDDNEFILIELDKPLGQD